MSRASVHPLPDVSDHTLLVVGTGPLQEPLLSALRQRGMDVECADPKEALEMSRAAVPDLVLLVGRAAMGGGQTLIRAFRSTSELAHTRLLVVARSTAPDESTVAQLEPSLGAEGLADAVLRVMHGLPDSSEDRVALQELVETATGTVVRQKPSRRPKSSIRPKAKPARPAPPPPAAAAPPPRTAAKKRKPLAPAPMPARAETFVGPAPVASPPPAPDLPPPPPAAAPPSSESDPDDNAEAVFAPPPLEDEDQPSPSAEIDAKPEEVTRAAQLSAAPPPTQEASSPPPLPTVQAHDTPAPPPLPHSMQPSAPSAANEPAEPAASLAPQRPSQRAPKATLVGVPVQEVLELAQARAAGDEVPEAPHADSDRPEVSDEEPTTVATTEPKQAELEQPAAAVPQPRVVTAEPHRPGLTSLSAMLVASGRPTQGARLELSQRAALPVVDPRSERPEDGEEQTANLRRVRKASKRIRQDSGPIEGAPNSDPSSLFDLPMMDSSESRPTEARSARAPSSNEAQAQAQEPSASALFASGFRQLGQAVRLAVRQGVRGIRKYAPSPRSELRSRATTGPNNETEAAPLQWLRGLSGPTAAVLGAAVAVATVGLVVLAWPSASLTAVPTLTITARPGQALPQVLAGEAALPAHAEAETTPTRADEAEPAAPAEEVAAPPAAQAPEEAEAAPAEADETDEAHEVDAEEDDLDDEATEETAEDDPEPSRDARVKQRVARANAAVLQGHRFRRQGAPNKAAAAYQRALRALPNYPRALTGMVQVSLARKQAKKALLYARKLVRKKPRDAQSQRLLGDAYRLSGNQKAAKTAWRKAARLGSRLARKRLN